MLVQLTDAGLLIMQAATAPVVLTSFKLGTVSGYVPSQYQTNLQGTTVYTGTPAAPYVEDSNLIKYSLVIGEDAGPFNFGEIGVYYNSTLFAVGVAQNPIQKLPLNTNDNTGGALVIDFYLPMVGDNYQMWANISQSNTLKVSTLNGPESLPSPSNAIPNMYIVDGLTPGVKPFLAYTDRRGEWIFNSYNEFEEKPVVAATSNSVTIVSSSLDNGTLNYTGQLLAQMITGSCFGACRYVTNIEDLASGRKKIYFNAPLVIVPTVGDVVRIDVKSSELLVPATSSSLGLVKAGTTMVADANGVLNVVRSGVLTDLGGNVIGALVTPQG